MTKQSCDPSELLYWPADDVHPPHDLIRKWTQFYRDVKDMPEWWVLQYVALRAAEYGADQELDLCAGYIDSTPAKKTAEDLVFARRLGRESVKQRALAELKSLNTPEARSRYNLILNAVESMSNA